MASCTPASARACAVELPTLLAAALTWLRVTWAKPAAASASKPSTAMTMISTKPRSRSAGSVRRLRRAALQSHPAHPTTLHYEALSGLRGAIGSAQDPVELLATIGRSLALRTRRQVDLIAKFGGDRANLSVVFDDLGGDGD